MPLPKNQKEDSLFGAEKYPGGGVLSRLLAIKVALTLIYTQCFIEKFMSLP